MWTRILPCLCFVALSLPTVRQPDPVAEIEAVLTDFHRAAAEGDGERYLSYLADDAILFGTDATERWTAEEYRQRLEPYFEQGLRMESVPVEQNVFVSESGDFAWFDERLERAKLGELRATGVLRRTDGEPASAGWEIVQFHLTFPIPNEVVRDVVKLIRASRK